MTQLSSELNYFTEEMKHSLRKHDYKIKVLKVCVYLEHLLRLLPLAGVHNLGFAVSVRVTNQRGDLAHFLLLEDVGLRADPHHDGLEGGETARRSQQLQTVTIITFNSESQLTLFCIAAEVLVLINDMDLKFVSSPLQGRG